MAFNLYGRDTAVATFVGPAAQDNDLTLATATTGTLAGPNTSETSFGTIDQGWEYTYNNFITGGSQSWTAVVDVSSFSGSVDWRFRLARYDSGGTLQSSSSWSATLDETATGENTITPTWDSGTWSAGDRLVLEVDYYRRAGHGQVRITFNVNASTDTRIIAPGTVITPDLEQVNFRGRLINGDSAAANAAFDASDPALNANFTIDTDTPFGIRFEVQNDQAVNGTITTPRVYYRVNTGGGYGSWILVPTLAEPWPMLNDVALVLVSNYQASGFTDGAATTNLISGSSETFEAGTHEHNNNAPSITLNAEHTEWEFRLIIPRWHDSGSNSDGDLYQFRIQDGATPLDTYTQTPTVTVNVPVGHIGGVFIEQPARIGPIADGNGNLYVLTEQTTQTNFPMMHKSSDGGDTWDEVDAANRPAQQDPEGMDVFWNPNVTGELLIAHRRGNEDTYHHLFRTSDFTPSAPAVVGVGTEYNTGGTAVSAHNISVPGSMTNGNMLLVILPYDGGGGASSTDLTEFHDVSHTTASVGLWMGYREIDGTEGSTVLVTTGVAENAVGWAIEVSNWGGQAPEVSSVVEANTADPNPPSFTPSGGAIGRVWFGLFSVNGGIGTPVAAYPYSSGTNRDGATGGSGAVGGGFSALAQSVATDDPGIFDSVTANDTMAYTMTIEGPQPDTWGTVDELIDNTQGADIIDTDSVSIIGRDHSGTLYKFVFFTAGDGTNQRVYWNYHNGTAWQTTANLDNTASTNFTAVSAVYEPNNDVIRVFYMDHTNGDMYMVTFASGSTTPSARTQIATNLRTTDPSPDRANLVPAIVYDDGGVDVSMYAYTRDATLRLSTEHLRDGVQQGEVTSVNDNNHDRSNGASHQQVAGFAVDGTTVHLLYSSDPDQDIYHDENPDEAGWGTDTEIQDAVTCHYIRAQVFTHSAGNGGATVLGYIWDQGSDGFNGFVRYDEVVLAEPAAGVYPPFPRRLPRTVRM